MIRYDEPIIRPPAEAESLILQATLGCSHNKCAFCATYKSKRFRPRPIDDLFKEKDQRCAKSGNQPGEQSSEKGLGDWRKFDKPQGH